MQEQQIKEKIKERYGKIALTVVSLAVAVVAAHRVTLLQ